MKQVLSVVWQTAVLYVAALVGFVAGITVPSLRVSRVLSHTTTTLRTYDFDWLIAVLLVYAALLLLAAMRGRLRQGWPATTLALVLAVAGVLLFTRLGVKETAL